MRRSIQIWKVSPLFFLAVITAIGVLACNMGPSEREQEYSQPYALFQNFVVPDPLFGNNGLPYSPSLEMNYGPVGHLLDSDGNEVEGIEEYIAYFNGKYYYYGSSYAFGTFVHTPAGTWTPVTNISPDKAHFRISGLTIYESDDLMNWRFIDRWMFQDGSGRPLAVKKYRVIYNPNTGKYIMWGEMKDTSGGYNGLVISEADRPEGPWSQVRNPVVPAGFPAVNHDHDVTLGPDGRTGYIDNCQFANNYIYKMNEEFDGVVEYHSINIDDGDAYRIHGGSGLFYRDGWWYLVGSETCGNCIASETRYIRARDPMGPWEEPDTGIQESETYAIKPVVISWDSGHTQSKGVMELPDINGNSHFFIPFCRYNASPGGAPNDDSVSQAGDNNLALNGNCWIPLEFDAQGHILPLKFEPSVKFPLAKHVNAPVPTVYQVDGSITNRISIVQTFKRNSSNPPINSISIGVFQRAPDETPGDNGTGNRGLTGSQDPMLDAPLHVELKLPNGNVESWDVDPYQIAWAIMSVKLPLSTPCSCVGEFTLTLSTTATNGCYGVAVGEPSPLTSGGSYSHKLASGNMATYANAAMYLTLSEDPVGAPVITKQPTNVTVALGGYTGFVVETDTFAGVGFDWEVSHDGGSTWSDYTIPDETYPNENYGPYLRLGPINAGNKAHYEGKYRVRVFNNVGEVYSNVVTLTVQ
jgi:hypothetical protein